MQKICQNCKQENPPEAAFCRQCASPLGAGQPSQQQQQYAPPPPQYGNQQQQWNQPNYATPQMQNVGQTAGTSSSRATTSAILAAVGLFCCFIAGFAGAIMGWLEIQAIKEGKSSPDGMMMAQIGLWGGIIGIIINIVVNVIGVLFLGLMGSPGY